MAPSAFERWRAKLIFTPENSGHGPLPSAKPKAPKVTSPPPITPSIPLLPSSTASPTTEGPVNRPFASLGLDGEATLPSSSTRSQKSQDSDEKAKNLDVDAPKSIVVKQQSSLDQNPRNEQASYDISNPTLLQISHVSKNKGTFGVVDEDEEDRRDDLAVNSTDDYWLDDRSPGVSPLPPEDEVYHRKRTGKERAKSPEITTTSQSWNQKSSSGNLPNALSGKTKVTQQRQDYESGSEIEIEYAKSEMSRLQETLRSQAVQLRFQETLLAQEQDKVQGLRKQLLHEGTNFLPYREDKSEEIIEMETQTVDRYLGESWSEYQVLLVRFRTLQARSEQQAKREKEQDEDISKLRLLIRRREKELKESKTRDQDIATQNQEFMEQIIEIQSQHEQCEPTLAEAIQALESYKAEMSGKLRSVENEFNKMIQQLEEKVKNRDILIGSLVKREQEVNSDEDKGDATKLNAMQVKALEQQEELKETRSQLARSRDDIERQRCEINHLEELGSLLGDELDTKKREHEIDRERLATLTRTVNEKLPALEKEKSNMQRQLEERDRALRDHQAQLEAIKMTIQEHIIVERQEREELSAKYAELLRERRGAENDTELLI
jgi:hypothetical protein